ncbi:Flagella synthesis protein FlgN [Gammaproteobacteria bacterium]|nr:flagellar protein FlgN [Gammaproteobacteria bacterium]QOJ31017.1 MAG: flagellar protein FlgN [Gammaproteobacteria bacterium]CAG0938465.1 Flagella synthesis protein FlgN [Gammaproteobacteria bacterium]
MPREPLPDRDLARLLDQQIDAMQAVLSSLEEERRALAARDGDALLKAVGSKAESIAAAGEIDQRRQALLERLGIGDRPGRASRGFGADAGIGQRWQQVLALTRQCRALNDANGQLIRGQHRRIDGTLRLLRGEPSATPEYGPGGEARATTSRRALASY